jgi:hypothetical protein
VSNNQENYDYDMSDLNSKPSSSFGYNSKEPKSGYNEKNYADNMNDLYAKSGSSFGYRAKFPIFGDTMQ